MTKCYYCVCRVSLSDHFKIPLLHMRKLLTQFGYRTKTFSARKMSLVTGVNQGELEEIVDSLSLNDFNRVLFRCDSEERDDGEGFGAYSLDNYGQLKYCGLMGLSFD